MLPMWSNTAQCLYHAIIQISDIASQPLLIKNSHDPKGDLPEDGRRLSPSVVPLSHSPFHCDLSQHDLSQPPDLESLTSAC